MSQSSHLYPVTSSDGGSSMSAGRGPQRPRAAKALPTDRMKKDRQVAVLRALGRLSGPRKDPVNGSALAQFVGGISAATVVLSNKFFVDAGWLKNSGKGEYAATDALAEYMLRLATGTNDYANEALREAARQSWFWETLGSHLAHGRLSVNEATALLMRAAGATPEHKPMILNVIAWLEHVGLVRMQDDFIEAVTSGDTVPADPSPEQQPAEGPATAQSPPETPATRQEELPRTPVIAFGVDVELTVADLAQLTPEQIKAFFDAVGTLAALKRKV